MTYQESSRPGFDRLFVRVHRSQFELIDEYGTGIIGGRDWAWREWVTVQVEWGRPALWEYLLNWLRRRRPPPSPSPTTGVTPGR